MDQREIENRSVLESLQEPQHLAWAKALLGACHDPLQGEEYADNAKLLKDLLGGRIGEEGHRIGKDRHLDDRHVRVEEPGWDLWLELEMEDYDKQVQDADHGPHTHGVDEVVDVVGV